MKNIDDFILELNNFKAKMGLGEDNPTDKYFTTDDNNERVLILDLILKRKQNELKSKAKQIQEEIEREINDFFDYLHMKQASIETLHGINTYIQGETEKVEEMISKIKVMKGE